MTSARCRRPLDQSAVENGSLLGRQHRAHLLLIERFRLSEDGSELHATQEFEDPRMLENRGARFIGWKKKSGDPVYPYECDPTFALEYQSQLKGGKQ